MTTRKTTPKTTTATTPAAAPVAVATKGARMAPIAEWVAEGIYPPSRKGGPKNWVAAAGLLRALPEVFWVEFEGVRYFHPTATALGDRVLISRGNVPRVSAPGGQRMAFKDPRWIAVVEAAKE